MVVAALSRAVTSEPIASGSSSSVDKAICQLMSRLMLRRTKDSYKVISECGHEIA